MQHISIRGARTHNLQNLDLDLPRDRLIVITGLSGSGKSSLAFDLDDGAGGVSETHHAILRHHLLSLTV